MKPLPKSENFESAFAVKKVPHHGSGQQTVPGGTWGSGLDYEQVKAQRLKLDTPSHPSGEAWSSALMRMREMSEEIVRVNVKCPNAIGSLELKPRAPAPLLSKEEKWREARKFAKDSSVENYRPAKVEPAATSEAPPKTGASQRTGTSGSDVKFFNLKSRSECSTSVSHQRLRTPTPHPNASLKGLGRSATAPESIEALALNLKMGGSPATAPLLEEAAAVALQLRENTIKNTMERAFVRACANSRTHTIPSRSQETYLDHTVHLKDPNGLLAKTVTSIDIQKDRDMEHVGRMFMKNMQRYEGTMRPAPEEGKLTHKWHCKRIINGKTVPSVHTFL